MSWSTGSPSTAPGIKCNEHVSRVRFDAVTTITKGLRRHWTVVRPRGDRLDDNRMEPCGGQTSPEIGPTKAAALPGIACGRTSALPSTAWLIDGSLREPRRSVPAPEPQHRTDAIRHCRALREDTGSSAKRSTTVSGTSPVTVVPWGGSMSLERIKRSIRSQL